MATELDKFITWTFSAECPVPQDVSDMLVPGEQTICAYKTIRDVAIFTNKRIIVRDAQGLTGKSWKFTPFRIRQSICTQQKMPESFLILIPR